MKNRLSRGSFKSNGLNGKNSPIDIDARLPRRLAPSLVAAEAREQRELLAGNAGGSAPRCLWAFRAWTRRIVVHVAEPSRAEIAKLSSFMEFGVEGFEGGGIRHGFVIAFPVDRVIR